MQLRLKPRLFHNYIFMNKLQNGSDIRGVALEGINGEKVNLTPDIAKQIGNAFIIWLREKTKQSKNLKIAIGMDSRLSGPALKNALIKAITKTGCDIYDCGLASTPAMFMTTITEPYLCDGAIMLTASHLPFNRNGMKFFSNEGGLNSSDITQILRYAQNAIFQKDSIVGKIEKVDFMSIYSSLFTEKIKREVNSAIDYEKPLKGLKMLVDAGNGAGGFYAEQVLKPLGADISGSQFLTPDGYFPNHVPNPEDSEAMKSVQEAVLNNNADIGIIFDTDVDRAAIVDSKGNAINRNELIALSAAIVLREMPNSYIVTDSITSDGLAYFIENKLNGKHHRYKRGYKNVINEAIRLNENGMPCGLAIETSGHAALKENYFLDDGAYLVTKIIIEAARLALENKSLDDLIAELPKPKESSEFRIKILENDFRAYGSSIISELEEYSNFIEGWNIVPNNYEGIRIACSKDKGDGWFLLRLSLHDPVIPVNIESNIEGGVAFIAIELFNFLKKFKRIDLSAFNQELGINS